SPPSLIHERATTAIYTLSLHDALPICTLPNPTPTPGRGCNWLGIIAGFGNAVSSLLGSDTRLTLESRAASATPKPVAAQQIPGGDRKSTRLNSSHVKISYAVFCLKKKK